MPIGISQDNGYAWRKAMGISEQVDNLKKNVTRH